MGSIKIDSTPCVKVMHVVEGRNRGAVENWLLGILEEGVNQGIKNHWLFFCTAQLDTKFQARAESLGASVRWAQYRLADKLRFLYELRRTADRYGAAVVHSHHDILSGLYFLPFVWRPAIKRITHVHNVDLIVPTGNAVKAAALRRLLVRLTCVLSTTLVGASSNAVRALTRAEPNAIRKALVLYCGVNPARFTRAYAQRTLRRAELQKQLGICQNSKVLAFVGRLEPEKNPALLLEVVSLLDETYILLFVGDGSLRERLQEAAAERRIKSRVHFLGWMDRPEDVLCASNALLMPTYNEGFGLAVLESQVLGVPVIGTVGIPDDAVIADTMVQRLPIDATAELWAARVADLCMATEAGPPEIPKHLTHQSSLRSLMRLYET